MKPERENKLFSSRLGPPKTPPMASLQPAKAPTLGQTSIPMFRAAGAPGRGSLMGRLKALRSKELAFIVAGISTLLMAPVAEHLISNEGENAGTLQSGFDQKGSVFSDAAAFEDGLGGIAPGGLVGQDQGVITPGNFSDPASLIMGPEGDEQRAPARPQAQPAREPERPSGWKDALATAARRSVTKATKSARLPMPGGKLASKISSISSKTGQGSSGASVHSLAPISSKGLVASRPETGSSLSRISTGADYRGTGRSLASGAGGSGKGFLQTGKSVTGPGGSGSSGEGGSGGMSGGKGSGGSGSPSLDSDGKPGAVSSAQDNRNIGINQKEDLAYQRRKMEMQKQIDLKYAKKQYDQIERKKMMEQMAAQTASQAALKILEKGLDALMGGGKGGQSSSGGGGGGSQSSAEGSAGGTGQFKNMQDLGEAFDTGSQANINSGDPSREVLGTAQSALGKEFVKQSSKETGTKSDLTDLGKSDDKLETDQKRVKDATAQLTKDDVQYRSDLETEKLNKAMAEENNMTYDPPPPPPEDKTKKTDEGKALSKPGDDQLTSAEKQFKALETGRPDAQSTAVHDLAEAAARKNHSPGILAQTDELIAQGNSLHNDAVGDLRPKLKDGGERHTGLTGKTDGINTDLATAKAARTKLITDWKTALGTAAVK